MVAPGGPKRPKEAPRDPLDGPQDGPKMVPRWPKMAQDGPKMAQDTPKMDPRCTQEGPKTAQESKMGARCPDIAETFIFPRFLPHKAPNLLGNETESEGRIADRSRLDVKW